MVTLKDVGELAGVTATTASAALRGKDYVKPETTQRVCDAARKLGYKINLSGRSLRSGRSDTITFLTSGLEGDYFSHLAMCVAEEVHKRDSHMLIELSRYLTDDNDLSYTFRRHHRHQCATCGRYPEAAPGRHAGKLRHQPARRHRERAERRRLTGGNRTPYRAWLCAHRHRRRQSRSQQSQPSFPGSRAIRMRAAKETILAAGLPFDERRDFIKSSWSIDGGIEAGRGWPRKASASTTVCTA